MALPHASHSPLSVQLPSPSHSLPPPLASDAASLALALVPSLSSTTAPRPRRRRPELPRARLPVAAEPPSPLLSASSCTYEVEGERGGRDEKGEVGAGYSR